MPKVAIILTGDPRHIDFCWPWWQGVVEHADYETTFYSTTWEPKPNIRNSQTTTVEEVKQFENNCSSQLHRYLNFDKPNTLPFEYYFGRLYQLHKTLEQNIDADVIVHARWDCAIRNTNFFNDFIKNTLDNNTYTFDGLEEKQGLWYTNDWLYAGPTEFFKRDYTFEGFKAHIKLYDTFLEESLLKANTYLIGHNFYSTFLKQNGAKISNLRCDTTLVRQNYPKFAYNDDTWSKLLAIFLAK